MKSRLTIKDIAQQAGVSTATVSRVMNNSGPVSDATRRAINEIVSKSGFRLNTIGRQLKTARTHTIGVLVPSLKNPIFADAVAGIEQAAEEAGYRVLLASSAYQSARELSAIETFLNSRVEGLILTVSHERDNETLELLRATQVPFVLMFNPCKRNSCSTVSIDNRAAAGEMIESLIALGHRRIAMIAGKLSESDRSVERRAGYRDALERHAIEALDVIEVGFEDPDLDGAIHKLILGPAPPTAFFCSTDLLAISAIRALTQRGIRVPEDVSVVGFDGIAIGELLTPNLTTVVQPAEEMGQWAARHLVGRIDQGERLTNLVLPHRIRHGESCGQHSNKG
ncbi:MAG: substrate-binding domain-containing protein [Gammaproteobacteria bacterium]|nr:substrate-binding domain-containing protein [Gammaproteobacteria bacterium]